MSKITQYIQAMSYTTTTSDANRRRIALERSRERRFYEEMDKLDRDKNTRAASASTSYPSHRINITGGGNNTSSTNDQQQHYSVDSNHYSYSSSSAPRSEGGPTPVQTQLHDRHSPNGGTSTSYHRSPLEFQGQHISFLPPHVIESLRPYYKNAAEAMPQLDSDGRPRPPSFVFAPKHLDSGKVPSNYHHHQSATSSFVDFASPSSSSPPGQRPPSNSMNNHNHNNSSRSGHPADHLSTSRYTRGGYDDERGNVATSTQTTFDPNAKVSYVDISASNAVLQRRVERLEQQLQESIEQKEKLNQVIKSMSYSIVPPLAFLPKEFYEKNKNVIDTCADYAILYRTALRATPNVGGDLDVFERKVDEQSKEHLMDRVVCLTSEVMQLRKLVANMERVNAMSP